MEVLEVNKLGHSGQGAHGSGGTARGNYYGLLRAPVALGSGGGNTAYVVGGNGGGAFRLVNFGEFSVNFPDCIFSLSRWND